MTTITQANRLISISTPLGEDALLLRGFSGTEGVSFPFSFELDLVSQRDIVFQDIIGQNVTLSFPLADDTPRYFNGIIANFSQQGSGLDEESRTYSASMVPWFWLLSMTSDSRIFQNKTVQDVVEQIFNEKRFADFRFSLNGTYEPMEYCAQYRETDFNFVSRLLEQYGIFYFFEHEDGKHTMIVTDNPDGHPVCQNQETARYHHTSGGERPDEDVITNFDKRQEIRVGKVTVNDFNPLTPNTDLKIETESIHRLGPGEREIYDYPAEYTTRANGETLANIRMQGEELKITTITGESTCRAFSSGCKFELTDFPISEMNEETYVLVSINHGISESIGGSGEGGGASYTNSFTCIPFDVPYRPPLVTPKPMIGGVQTAIVVGPDGEEIYTDEYGRVKVQFHWDREGQRNESSSCWIRVSQVCAGAGWGAIDIPRIGHEVIVDFLEGDPDRPIITGRVYHANNLPPLGLPDSGMVSGMKSNSTPGGGGYNEMTMDDTKGKEAVTIHAQKDMATTVENNRTATIKSGNDTLTVQSGTQTTTVKGDAKLTIEAGNRNVSVTGGDHSIDVTSGNFKASASAAANIQGKGSGVIVKGVGGPGVKLSGEPNFEASGKTAAKITSPAVTVTGKSKLQLNSPLITIGPRTVFVDGSEMIVLEGGTVAISGATSVVITGGGGTVTLDSGGVKVSGGQIKLN